MQTTEPVAEFAPGVEAPKPQTLAQCHEVIDTLVQLVAELQCEIAWLHERGHAEFQKVVQTPSSDGLSSANQAQRRASPRKRGVQKGHPGSYRVLVKESQVDQIVDCPAPEVCECGASVTPAGEPGRRFQQACRAGNSVRGRWHSSACWARATT